MGGKLRTTMSAGIWNTTISPSEWAALYEERQLDYADGVLEARDYVGRLQAGGWLPGKWYPPREERHDPPATVDEITDAAFERTRKRLQSLPPKQAAKPIRPTPKPSRFRCVARPVFTWQELLGYATSPDDRADHSVRLILDVQQVGNQSIPRGVKCGTCKRDVHLDVDTFKWKHGRSRRRKPPPWKVAA